MGLAREGLMAISVLRDRVFRLHNHERHAHQRKSLLRSSLLNASAQARAKHLAKTGVLEHGTWWKVIYKIAGKVRFKELGENIAEGQNTPEQVVEEWMDSPGHKKNILEKKYKVMGVGFARKGDDEYWVVHFGG